MSGVNYHGWTHKPKIYGGTDPIPGGQAVYAIEVFEVDVPVTSGDGKFEWEIPEDLDGDVLTKVEAYVNTAGSGTTVQVRNETQAHDMLSTPITIDTGDLNSKDAATQPVVSVANSEVAWGDHINIDVDTAGGAIGLGVILYFFAMTTRTIVLEGTVGPAGADGADGAPGGITDWTGEWTTATGYTADQSVSYNGSSYAAIDNHTSGSTSEPGVGANWEDHWQLLAEAASSGAAADGWTTETVTWTYASATTFTVSGDVTAQFAKGTRLKLTQTTAKYFVVTNSSYSAPNTTVTITAGTTYTLANAAITSPFYSYQASPQSYPGYFAYTPTWTATSSNPAIGNGSISGTFSVLGRSVTVDIVIAMGSTTTYGTGQYRVSPPIALAGKSIGVAWVYDASAGIRTGTVYFDSDNNVIRVWGDDAALATEYSPTVPQTWANTDALFISGRYLF